MSTKTINLNETLYHYLLSHSLHEDPVLQELRKETAKLPPPASRMQISPEQGQFMALLMRLMSAKKTLDVGTFTGYSALVVALALPKEGKVVTCDVSETYTNIAKSFWAKTKSAEKIDLKLGSALTSLDGLIAAGEAGTYDFAFIDADKTNYPGYYEKALTLLRPGGLVAIDNVLWGGKVADSDVNDKDTKTIRAFNAQVREDRRVMLSMIPIGDGLTLALKL